MKYCLRCGMPLDMPALYGTDAEGKSVSEYCCYCLEKGCWLPRKSQPEEKQNEKNN
ncbi:zinc ribbon domain-containing protein [Porphyromonas macacae]|uniref:zinc ribbon domain-containing protein n=1 Tax=Porphyromonas macacae TaxID=28115 RepID=UPI0003725E34|nr:zinc ribbon domain-containing protein [Porphyromonas macacae]